MLRLTVTRTGDRGLAMSSEADQNWLITGSPANPPPAGMRVKVIDICRPASAPTSRLKSVNYLDNILARRQAVEAGADEALMVNEHGRLACAGAANIFFMRDNEILTPPIAEGALPGTRRARLLSHAPEIHDQTGLQLLEVPVTRQDLAGCDAAFLTNSLMGAVPITRIDDCAKEKSPAMQAISVSRLIERSAFRLNHLTAAIHTAFQVNMMRTVQFAAVFVFDISRVFSASVARRIPRFDGVVFRFGTAIVLLHCSMSHMRLSGL